MLGGDDELGAAGNEGPFGYLGPFHKKVTEDLLPVLGMERDKSIIEPGERVVV